MKLYGIWYADYSNSSCGDAVYTSRDDADAVARATGDDVLEFKLDPPLDEKAVKLRRPGERVYYIGIDADGNNATAGAYYQETEPDETLRVSRDGRRLATQAWASSEEAAIKIVNDRRRQWLAAGKPMPHRNPLQNGWESTGWPEAL